MKKKYLILLLVGFAFTVNAQIELNVTGFSLFQIQPEKMVVKMIFEENERTCGPNSDFESIEEQIGYLESAMLKHGFDLKLLYEDQKITELSSEYRRNTLKYPVLNKKQALKLFAIAKDAFAHDVKFINIYPPHSFDHEYNAALEALKSARKKAEKICQELGKENLELVYIDDITSLGTRNGYRILLYDEENEISSYSLQDRKRTYTIKARYIAY